MTDRDKLIGLLGNLSISCEEKIGCINCKYNKETCCKLKRKADYLLENGVIVAPMPMAEWLKQELTEYVHKRCMEEL